MTKQKKEEKSELTKHFDAVTKKISKFLSEDNPSDVQIIKAHLICEYYLNHILILKEVCTAKEILRFTFYTKCEKALDTNAPMETRCRESLFQLNKLRNKVGHELEYVLSESDVDNIGFVQGKKYVLRKYDFETLPDLLRNVLLTIIVDISFLVYKMAADNKKERKKKEKDEK